VTISRSVAQHISRLKRGVSSLAVARQPSGEFKSFGVFLGAVNNPATPAQARVLSQWDVVVLDPFASGVKDALASGACTSSQTLGRLDVRSLVKSERSSDDGEIIRSIQILVDSLAIISTGSGGTTPPFTAVLLANFIDHFSPAILNQLVGYINSLGYAVWLEIALSGPGHLSGPQCRDIHMKFIDGVIYRNGTIRTDGGQQNYHQMEPMRTAMRGIAAQRVAHGPPTMLWETVDDEFNHQYAITQRSYNWCRFNSALCWIGSASALVDAEAARTHTIREKPLGALMWQKNDANMRAHNVWRANDKVSCLTLHVGSHVTASRMIGCCRLMLTERLDLSGSSRQPRILRQPRSIHSRPRLETRIRNFQCSGEKSKILRHRDRCSALFSGAQGSS